MGSQEPTTESIAGGQKQKFSIRAGAPERPPKEIEIIEMSGIHACYESRREITKVKNGLN